MNESYHNPESSTPPTDGHGFDTLGQQGRVDFRMVKDDHKITPDAAVRIVDDLKAYRADHANASKPLSWQRLAEMIGIPASTLHEVVKGKYKGERENVLRRIDQFLADDRERAGRFDFRTHAQIGLTRKVFGVIRAGIRHNWMPVIIGSPGVGKTAHARAFAADRAGVVMIRADEAHRDDRGVTTLLCNAIDGLRPQINKPHRKRLFEIKGWLRKHGSTVIVIDEAQKLSKAGLEMLRDIHDISDAANRSNVPIIFFGDHRFKQLIERTRVGSTTVIEPQLARRLRPVLDIDKECTIDDDGGLFTADDIVKIVRNDRVRILTSSGVRWIRDLANVDGYGRLGFAIGVLQLAIDISLDPGSRELTRPIDVDTLQEALKMTFGESIAIEIDEAASGELLTKTA